MFVQEHLVAGVGQWVSVVNTTPWTGSINLSVSCCVVLIVLCIELRFWLEMFQAVECVGGFPAVGSFSTACFVPRFVREPVVLCCCFTSSSSVCRIRFAAVAPPDPLLRLQPSNASI